MRVFLLRAGRRAGRGDWTARPMAGHMAGAAEHISVGVASPVTDIIVARTSFQVERWDDDQTSWLSRKFEDRYGGLPSRPDFAFTPAQFAAHRVAPYSVTREDDCNMVVQTGWAWLLGGITTVTGTTQMSPKFSASNGRIGVGTSATAPAYGNSYLAGDTGAGSATSYYQLISAAPTVTTASSPPQIVLTASFGVTAAVFAWQEFGTDNAPASGVNLNGLAGGYLLFNRGVSNQGQKGTGQTWSATETIQFGYPTSQQVS